MSKFYLAGPMRGISLYNIHAFALGAYRLRQHAHTVFNPMEVDLAFFKLEPHLPLHDQDFNVGAAMRRDFKFIIGGACDAVALLPGWKQSTGAVVEVLVASNIGLPIYQFDDEILVWSPVHSEEIARLLALGLDRPDGE